MADMNQNQGYYKPSIAFSYKQLDHPIRRDIINILYNDSSQAFRIMSEKLEIDRAALAYHLRILRNANLIENFYDNIRDSKSYSYYRLTDYARWLLNNDLNLSLESQKYQPPASKSEESEKIMADEKSLQGTSITRSAGTAPENSTSIIEENFKVIRDPRLRYSKYKISL